MCGWLVIKPVLQVPECHNNSHIHQPSAEYLQHMAYNLEGWCLQGVNGLFHDQASEHTASPIPARHEQGVWKGSLLNDVRSDSCCHWVEHSGSAPFGPGNVPVLFMGNAQFYL